MDSGPSKIDSRSSRMDSRSSKMDSEASKRRRIQPAHPPLYSVPGTLGQAPGSCIPRKSTRPNILRATPRRTTSQTTLTHPKSNLEAPKTTSNTTNTGPETTKDDCTVNQTSENQIEITPLSHQSSITICIISTPPNSKPRSGFQTETLSKHSIGKPIITRNDPKNVQTFPKIILFKTMPTLFKCNFCGVSFVSKSSVKNHILKNHVTMPANKIPCELCRQTFDSEIQLEKHKTSSHNFQLSCLICSQLHVTLKELRAHYSREHGSGTFRKHENLLIDYVNKTVTTHTNLQCFICNKSFTSKSEIPKHVLRIHFQITRVLCPYCRRYFPIQYDLTKHLLLAHHSMITKLHSNIKQILEFRIVQHCILNHKSTKKSQFLFKMCCFENFSTVTEVFDHFQEHHKSVFECAMCGQRVEGGSLENLTEVDLALKRVQVESCMQDMLAISNMKQFSRYHCSYCKNSFTNKIKLRHHVKKIHLKITRFQCAYCNDKFCSEENVEEHLSNFRSKEKRKCFNISRFSDNFIDILESDPKKDSQNLFEKQHVPDDRELLNKPECTEQILTNRPECTVNTEQVNKNEHTLKTNDKNKSPKVKRITKKRAFKVGKSSIQTATAPECYESYSYPFEEGLTRIFRCLNCSFVSKNQDEMYTHCQSSCTKSITNSMCTADAYLKCENCNRIYNTYIPYIAHISSCFKPTYKCDFCNFYSTDLLELTHHFTSEHSTESSYRKDGYLPLTCICVHCKQRAQYTGRAYREHLRSCYISVYKCSSCEFTCNVREKIHAHSETYCSVNVKFFVSTKAATTQNSSPNPVPSSSCAQNIELATDVVMPLRNGNSVTLQNSSDQENQIGHEAFSDQNFQEILKNNSTIVLERGPVEKAEKETITLPEIVYCDKSTINLCPDLDSTLVEYSLYSHEHVDPLGGSEGESFTVQAQTENVIQCNDINQEEEFFMDVEDENVDVKWDPHTALAQNDFDLAHGSTFLLTGDIPFKKEIEIFKEGTKLEKEDVVYLENEDEIGLVVKREVESVEEVLIDEVDFPLKVEDLIEIKEETLDAPSDSYSD